MDKKNKSRDQAHALINEIASDNRSGAAEILSRAADVLSLLCADEIESRADIESARDEIIVRSEIIETCAALVRAQPFMSSLVNLASEAVAAATESTGASEAERAAALAARSFVEKAARAAATAAERAAELINDGATVLTHSRSSTVLAAFTKALRAGKRIKVIATESRPMFEGRALAETLARAGVSVTIVADAAAALAIKQADLIIVGADCVTPDSVINKIGTRMIALAARELRRPVYALCDISKFLSYSPATEERRSGCELWPDAPREVAVMNRYFEPTPLAHFTSIVTEDGLLAPEEASGLAASIKVHEALILALSKTRPGAVDKA